jgi:hypothetical protein
VNAAVRLEPHATPENNEAVIMKADDLKRMKVKGGTLKVRDREKWRLAVEEARDHTGL